MTAVVFDMGGVVLDWDPRRLFLEVLGNEQAVDEFVAEVDFFGWNSGLDGGAPFGASVTALHEQFGHWSSAIDAFDTRWPETIGPPIPGTLELVDELRANGVAVYVLSNSSAETLPRSPDAVEAFTHFDDVLLSGSVGLLKPDPAIFHEAASRWGLDGATTWFVDDNEPNVVAARDVGWNAHLFVDAATLRAELSAAGLVPADGRSS